MMTRTVQNLVIGLLLLVLSQAPLPYCHSHASLSPQQLQLHQFGHHRQADATELPSGWHCHWLPWETQWDKQWEKRSRVEPAIASLIVRPRWTVDSDSANVPLPIAHVDRPLADCPLSWIESRNAERVSRQLFRLYQTLLI
ncbi:hypothetical protein [Lignipirellula cremea]|uniref:Uncharacterized protein n=1 Tax=Lignipirellula cremea TaxID=2528010 RepID=A0A518DTT5_9BACT|nr:hypothetical protein [Lignipirellula cremea]QDU95245.1 hypothetical protein Pla8534_30600 [Lignipirellula cremea]